MIGLREVSWDKSALVLARMVNAQNGPALREANGISLDLEAVDVLNEE